VAEAPADRTPRRQRVLELVPLDHYDAARPTLMAFAARLFRIVHSPVVDQLFEQLKQLKQTPPEVRAAFVQRAQRAPTASAPSTSALRSAGAPWTFQHAVSREDAARWILEHAMQRGVVLPALGRREWFIAIAELFLHDEDIAEVMSRERDWRAPDRGDKRGQDQGKVRVARHSLKAKRRFAGYK
jgi:hypothetical protein